MQLMYGMSRSQIIMIRPLSSVAKNRMLHALKNYKDQMEKMNLIAYSTAS